MALVLVLMLILDAPGSRPRRDGRIRHFRLRSGAIIGIGAGSKESKLQWKTVREMLLAWAVTLPAAALVAAVAFSLLA